MNKLSKIFATGLLSIIPLIANSPSRLEQYIPLESKLREIEKSKTKTKSNVCMHKAIRYYLNLKENNEDATFIIGWVRGTGYLHAWVEVTKNKKDYYLDPAYNIIEDGFEKEFYIDRKTRYIFNKDATINDFVLKRNVKEKFPEIDKDVIKEYNSIKNIKKYSFFSTKDSLISSIEEYCKQDTSAWNYYIKNIEKK